MNLSSSGSARSILAVQRIQELYDRNLFLDAFAQTAEYWNPSVRFESLSVAELILGGRLASRLGSSRLSQKLFTVALERDPRDPAARYFSSYLSRRTRNFFHMLRAFEAEPELEGADSEIQSSRLAYHAVIYASVRDFDRAHHSIVRAREHKARDSWVLSCESDVFGAEDRWVEALESAEQAWKLSPGTPYAARSLAGSLLNLGRVQEAAERMAIAAESGQSHEIATVACWYLCALAETCAGFERKEILNRAQTLAEGLESLSPLADRETRRQFALTRLDIAEMSDDSEGIERWTAEARSPFHRKMLENLRANPQGRRIRLPFRRAIQKHNACLPTSLSSALAVQNVHIDPDTMVADITFGGTWEWAAAEWLEKRGFATRFFAVSPEVAARLIQNGIAFVITLEGDSSAHAVAAVGLDEAARTLIIHDPGSFRTTEYLLESIGTGHAPLGPLGMVVVPHEKVASVDQLLPQADVGPLMLQQQYSRARFLYGPQAASRIAEDLTARFPHHPVTVLVQASQALLEGQTAKALVGFQKLASDYPNAAFVRSDLLASCRALQNTALMREIIAAVVESGALPGVQSQQEWRYPPVAYVSEYADLLMASNETGNKARSLLHSQIRRQPSYGPAWHILGDLLWREHDLDGALFAYRNATCLADNNEHYASAYCDALAEADREEEGLRWLESRVRKFGASARAVATWVTWISALEQAGRPERALAASAEALTLHPDSPELLGFTVPFLARMGQWEQAEALLLRLEATGNNALFLEGAVAFHTMRGELRKAVEHAERWVHGSPLSMEARYELIDLVAKRDGSHQAASLAKSWVAERPGHDGLEELYYRQLTRSQAPAARQYRLLKRRVQRNPEDAWAWRELGFSSVYKYNTADERSQKRIARRLTAFIGQCDRTSPVDAATLRIHAEWQQARGAWPESMELWFKAIERAPKVFYSYQHVWDCASHLDTSQRQDIWERMQKALLSSSGRLPIARQLILMAVQKLGVAPAEEAVSRWHKLKPEDPGIIEAHADLLLKHGHGRTDFERALGMLEPAVKRFPYDSNLRFSQADALRKLARFPEAEEVLHEIVRRHPDNSSAHIQLAQVQDRRGQVEGSLRRLDDAILCDPQNTALFDAKIEILMRAKNLRQAIAVIQETLARFPKGVNWREKSISLLLECGDAAAAVQAARDGILEYPDGAYLWLLLGRTLFDHQRFAAQGEIESVLRQSLAWNPGLYETADYLSMHLTGQRRYSEAAELMHQIAPRLEDPAPALGRLAWIHREEGKRDQALAEMTALLAEVPSYSWGWSVLMTWLEEDKDWGETRTLLGAIPPEVRTDLRFRQKRLLLLEKAGLGTAQVDSEWNTLLSDFPEEVPLHLLRYDSLREGNRKAEAAAVLETIRPAQPDSPYVLARFSEIQSEAGETNQAIESFLALLFADTEPSVWPANYAWQALRRAHYEEAAYQKARARIKQGLRPTPHAVAILAEYAIERNNTEKRSPQPLWRTWFPDRGAREVQALARDLDAKDFPALPFRGPVLRQLVTFGYQRLVVKYWKRHRRQVEADITAWSEVARAFTGVNSLRPQGRKFMSGWRNHVGVPMWIVANFVMCCNPLRRKQLREIISSCHDALAGLPHDHCARFLAHVESGSYALLGDEKAFLEAYRTYKNYFDGKLEQSEWFQDSHRHLLADIPAMGRFLEEGQRTQFKKMRRRLLWEKISSKFSRPKTRKGIDFRWIWWLIWILYMLSRLISQS
ncbi:MAG: hypothetical protein JWM08_1004 [Candidatus Angelobacter sp.]|nr:hypothetical protein [Candidatus Angelobacter sp.]